MKIVPTRSMLLNGRHAEEGKAVTVSDEEGRNAILRGWAVEATAKPANKAGKSKTEGGASPSTGDGEGDGDGAGEHTSHSDADEGDTAQD